MMARVPDWPDRLQTVFLQFDGTPWRWGETDCACFAAACVQAMTGVDVLGTFRGAYASKLGAFARLRGRQYRSVGEAAGRALEAAGAAPIPPQFAKVGDIGVTIDDILCVRAPAGFVARGYDGQLYLTGAEKAWRI